MRLVVCDGHGTPLAIVRTGANAQRSMKGASAKSSSEWLGKKQRMFGSDWPDVQRLLDALRLYGIHFSDAHLGNIRVRK